MKKLKELNEELDEAEAKRGFEKTLRSYAKRQEKINEVNKELNIDQYFRLMIRTY